MKRFTEGASFHAGFTLVELMVVIAIIAMLVAILLPVLGSAKTTARHIACVSNARQIITATVVYTTDNDMWLPPYSASPNYYYLSGYFYGSSNNNSTHEKAHSYNNFTFFRCLWPDYLPHSKIFFCPTSQYSSKGWSTSVWGSKSSYYYAYMVNSAYGKPYYHVKITKKDNSSVMIGEPTDITATGGSAPHSKEPRKFYVSSKWAAGGTHGYPDGHVFFLYPRDKGWLLRYDFRF